MSSVIYLYIKIHNKTGLKYLGKTTKKDPHKYKGSGRYWLKHIKKHGYDVTTKILFETTDPLEFEKIGIYYSKLFNVIESNEWANLCIENGKGASLVGKTNGMYGKTHTKKVKQKLAEKAKNTFKNKTYEQLYGIEKAKELKNLRAIQAKTRDHKGCKNSMFDKTEYTFININTNECYTGTRYSFYNKYNLSKTAVHRILKYPKYVYKNWTLK